jgi:hypothetical protein
MQLERVELRAASYEGLALRRIYALRRRGHAWSRPGPASASAAKGALQPWRASCSESRFKAKDRKNTRAFARRSTRCFAIGSKSKCLRSPLSQALRAASKPNACVIGRVRHANMRANPSLNRTRYGRPPWPGLRYAVHSLRPSQGVLPPRAGYLER